jgi:hypothetical protein
MPKIAPPKTSAQASANYINNGGSPNAATLWATNLAADLPAVFAAAERQVAFWQSQVSTTETANLYVAGLRKAAANTGPIITKINGPAKATYTAQVRAAGAAGGNYANFSAAWQPAISAELQNLNRTNPRGDFGTNLARLNALITWAHGQKGKFKQ